MRKQILHSSFFTIHLKLVPLHPQMTRALSSAGLEHLPYKQRVGGSNPSAPTTQERTRPQPWRFSTGVERQSRAADLGFKYKRLY